MPGPIFSDSEGAACLNSLSELAIRPQFLVASGSLPPGTPDDYYARVGRIAKDWNSKFVLDTSGLPLIPALAEDVYLCKPNLHELSELAGERLDDEAAWVRAAKGLVECGRTEVVALTLGDRGALLVTQDLVAGARESKPRRPPTRRDRLGR
jgi:6-phosphofructokinase 2